MRIKCVPMNSAPEGRPARASAPSSSSVSNQSWHRRSETYGKADFNTISCIITDMCCRRIRRISSRDSCGKARPKIESSERTSSGKAADTIGATSAAADLDSAKSLLATTRFNPDLTDQRTTLLHKPPMVAVAAYASNRVLSEPSMFIITLSPPLLSGYRGTFEAIPRRRFNRR
jgi:hypothetical protein